MKEINLLFIHINDKYRFQSIFITRPSPHSAPVLPKTCLCAWAVHECIL